MEDILRILHTMMLYIVLMFITKSREILTIAQSKLGKQQLAIESQLVQVRHALPAGRVREIEEPETE